MIGAAARKDAPSVRMRLRAATKERHEALHRHPLFSRLTASDVQHHELLAANNANLQLFEAIEGSRAELDVFGALTLNRQIAALRRDVGGSRGFSCATGLRLDCAGSVLGALYVAHGSGFGAKVIQKNLASNLQNACSSYYSMDCSFQWPLVCEALETIGSTSIETASCAANAVFALLDRTHTSAFAA